MFIMSDRYLLNQFIKLYGLSKNPVRKETTTLLFIMEKPLVKTVWSTVLTMGKKLLITQISKRH